MYLSLNDFDTANNIVSFKLYPETAMVILD